MFMLRKSGGGSSLTSQYGQVLYFFYMLLIATLLSQCAVFQSLYLTHQLKLGISGNIVWLVEVSQCNRDTDMVVYVVLEKISPLFQFLSISFYILRVLSKN